MSYPIEFRDMIIKKSLSAEMTQQQLVDEYGIGLSTLHKWLHAYKGQSTRRIMAKEKRPIDWNDEQKWQTVMA